MQNLCHQSQGSVLVKYVCYRKNYTAPLLSETNCSKKKKTASLQMWNQIKMCSVSNQGRIVNSKCEQACLLGCWINITSVGLWDKTSSEHNVWYHSQNVCKCKRIARSACGRSSAGCSVAVWWSASWVCRVSKQTGCVLVATCCCVTLAITAAL